MKQIGYTCIIQSIVHRWPLLSPIFRAVYESRVEKIVHLLKRSKNRSILWLLHEIGSVGQPGHAPLIETGGSQREQCMENTAGGVGLRILTFPSTFWPLLQRGVERCRAAQSLYRASRCIAAVCLFMLCSNALTAFDNEHLWLFHLVLTPHSTRRRAGPTKCRAWSWSREYSVWPSTWKHGRDIPMIFSFRVIVMNPFLVPGHNAMQKSLSFLPLKQLFTNTQTAFNVSWFQLIRDPSSFFLNHAHGLETFWNGLLCHSHWSC